MANEEHLAILRQGVEVWNKWRTYNGEIIPNLTGVNLTKANLTRINLRWANLDRSDFTEAKLDFADLRDAELFGVNLNSANLNNAQLSSANLRWSNLDGANLNNANLRLADLRDTILFGANLNSASLHEAVLFRTNLSGISIIATDFNSSSLDHAILVNIDFSNAKNLDLVRHRGPSSIGLDTLLLSKGKIPIEFLEGCGVPKHVIENMQYLVDIPTIQYYSCFISYSTKNEDFAQQLNDRMKGIGLRVWFAPEEMKAGQKIHEQLYEAIRYHDKLILVLSEASMNSNWVQSEIRRARKHEREDKRRKLFPISLVPFGEIQKWELFDADEGRDLAQEIREYYIPDFSQWKNYDKFNTEFDKLLKALKTEE
jgi:hypothetical protein